MTNKVAEQCKSKGCLNPVLYGKYCEHCKQKRKETRSKILAGAAGSPVVIGLALAIKKGVIKQGPKIVAKVVQVISRKL